ncbi:hypothetical protein OIU77_029429 [Salix suchowensis]|uniref:Pollen Ole e 1 allergen and extensin family protein n=1 Tax=Salix suchowensis TaxID=1278906 RepID=A0ABQ9BBT8_9ROSI|nr:Pollen domain-containing protein [Salix suchowensis]KAJ6363805.1 hypothetical protein OIU78_003885 [Salix suchowensis]KAJ6380535.1 hypothetical protein OIU77_029429 [Salix suchowensis]
MSYFSGCNNLVTMMDFIPTIFIFFAITFQASAAKAENPLMEFSSREELVQLAGYGEEKLSTVLVTGTVLCEACLHGENQLHAWPISGALVSVQCHSSAKRNKKSSAQAITDEYGDFLIDLPSHLHGIPHLERTCSVKVLRLPRNSVCRPAHARKQKALKLSSVGNGIRNYSAGEMKFLQLTSKPLQACNERGSGDKQIAW